MTKDDDVAPFVARLLGWRSAMMRQTASGRRAPEAAQARAALAEIRRGLGKRPGEALRAYACVAPLIPVAASDEQRDALFLVATLFADHLLPRDKPAGEKANYTLGHAFRAMEATEQGLPEAPLPAVERRFTALLNASSTRLPHHLRQAVRLAGTRGVAIDYFQLTRDLLTLLADDDHDHRERVKLAWARAYWGRPQVTADQPAAAQEQES
ncbi:MAG: type I-E CRISPR-associated protein Cse2/CasB [Armatimonadetes bacterium]|nr:type I-E CRISPR-associated protein Cse2/CasB [Armatimonadota bacterium]